MYSYIFYMIIWSVCFIMIIPVIFVGIIYVFMSNKTPKKTEDTLKIMYEIIKGAKTKQAFMASIEQFKKKYGVVTDEGQLDLWLQCIKELAHSTNWDTDAIAKFGQEMEDKNPTYAKKVSVAIATVLKTKEQKK